MSEETAAQGKMTLLVWPTYVGLAEAGETDLPEQRRAPITWSDKQVGVADCPVPEGKYVQRLYFHGPGPEFPVCGVEPTWHVQLADGHVQVEGIVNGDTIVTAHDSSEHGVV